MLLRLLLDFSGNVRSGVANHTVRVGVFLVPLETISVVGEVVGLTNKMVHTTMTASRNLATVVLTQLANSMAGFTAVVLTVI